MLDLRFPSGLYFSIVGLVLIVMGLVNPENHAPMMTANVNLDTGTGMLAFGLLLLVLAGRKARQSRKVD